MADGGEITFSTALDNEQLQKALKSTESEIKSIEKKLNAKNSDKSFIEAQMDEAQAAVKQTKAEIASLEDKLKSIKDVKSGPGIETALAERNDIESRLASAQARYDEQMQSFGELDAQWQKLDQDVGKYQNQLDGAKTRAAELGTALASSSREGSSAIAASLEGAHDSFDKFTKRINTMMKKVFVFGVILAGIRSIKSFLSDAMGENVKLQSSFEALKASLAGLAQPLLGIIIPAVTGAVNILVAMINTLARLIDTIFKTNLSASIKNAKAAANATRDQAKAKKELAKQTKEATKSIMAFDEINQMDSQDTGASSGEGADGGTGGADWDAFDAGKIDAKLAEIMIILGAALMAVGAILAFSGINIPLGLSLLAIGALMVYTAASENWDQLPAQVQQAITAVLVLSGIVLLSLGAILALSGAAMPIGVGLMAAGAALLWAAIGLNWDSMPPQMKTVVLAIMGILGAALLVIGAILTFTGAGMALGLGLMLVGAASLAASVALAWDALPEDMRSVIAIIAALVGAALLVIGAVLTFTGVALPLGIGLLVAGAAMLAASAALSWDMIPNELRTVVSVIMGIVGAALLVIGVVLLFTGAGIPLGLGCILAGGALLAGTVAFNWNYIPDMIASVWRSVTSFFNTYIAPIFTFQFWENMWKSLVNGLIWAVNSGLNLFGGFINNITSGISGLLSMFGVDWSWNIRMPQIPYLAQGAVIPPNRKFMAVLGDQTNGRNLEAPEGLIRQIVREESGAGIDAAALAAAVQQGVTAGLALAGGTDPGDSDVTIVLQVGNEELARATNKGNRRLAQRGEIRGEFAFV